MIHWNIDCANSIAVYMEHNITQLCKGAGRLVRKISQACTQ